MRSRFIWEQLARSKIMASSDSGKVNLDSPELSLIDAGIQSMKDVPLYPYLQSLNLHSNYIQHIQGLEQMRNLKHLDMSANQIASISGLDGLVSLKTLNLSCNLITVVEGLTALRSLVKLNLSYNQIEDLSGLRPLVGSEYRLTHLELHGNRLRNLAHIQHSLMLCSSLQHLILSQDGSSNPVCHQDGYQMDLFTALRQLETLNGIDRQGRQSVPPEMMTDVPELEAYLEFLLSGEDTATSTASEVARGIVKTPRIDEVLARFRQPGAHSAGHSAASTTLSATDGESSPHSGAATPGRQQRTSRSKQGRFSALVSDQFGGLAELEEEVKRLRLAQYKVSPGGRTPRASSASSSHRDDTDDEVEPVKERKAGNDKMAKAQAKKSNLGQVHPRQTPTITPPVASQIKTDNRRASASKQRSAREPELRKRTRADESTEQASNSSASQDASARTRALEDRKQREELQSTYVQLLKELETERERRWKAEHAARRLADHVKDIQAKQNEEIELKTTALEATGRLKQVLLNERDSKTRLQDHVTALQAHVADLQQQVSRARQAEDVHRAAARALEERLASQEREHLHQQAHQAKKVQEGELRAAALGRELDVFRSSSRTQKAQIQQLQELLAAREQQHNQDMSERYRLDSKELKEVIYKEVQLVEKRHRQEMTSCHEKIEALSKQYTDLEDEFRLALQIEAGKFREIQSSYERVSAENAENKQLLLAAQKKDENSSLMLTELTALVKEQKGRITELSRAKQEQATQYRERVETLEASLEEARKRMVQFELLKQESVRLQSTVHAQESIIEGLKAERRLWGQELAQQGASLSQDRGRLEAKIETLQQEIITIKKQLERETDLVKIKTKMVDDQTETIRKLKEGLLERDEQIRAAREETLRVQRSLEEQLSEEKAAHQDLQEALDEICHRKNELKQQVAALQADLEASQQSHQQLSARWREKSDLIGKLEKQVSIMKSMWEEKEKGLTQERDKAVEATSLAVEKMRGMDDGFRRQLEAAEKSHREELAHITQEKEQEVHIAEQKVLIVEEEMRRLLRETEQSKRTMEDKVKRLTQALGDLQSDLL